MTDMIAVDHMEPNPWNPNVMDAETQKMLKKTLQKDEYDPLVITPKDAFFEDPGQPHNRYIITDGRQRWFVAGELGLSHLKVEIKPMTEAEARKECYSRSRVRGQLDPFKEGELFNLEVEDLGSEAAVAEKYDVSRSYVASRRSLVKVAEPVKQMLKTPEAFLEIKKEEIAENIRESNPEEDYTEQQMKEMVAVTLEQDDIVPRGTLTPSHLEALASLEEDLQTQVATKIVEENLTVRDTEIVVKLVKERIERKKRFETALERAVNKVCPSCGSPPKDFESTWTYTSGLGRTEIYKEDRFECAGQSWHDWDYMEDLTKAKRRQELQEKEQKAQRSEQLREANLNPGYIRRAEDHKELFESMRPWVLRKVMQITEVRKVEITGLRADGKMIRLLYPNNYGGKLYVVIGDPRDDDGHWMDNETRFSFDIEEKNYKKLPFKSKLDTKASPENRTLVNHFLDSIIHGDGDPVLPGDPNEVKRLMEKYGEAS